MTTSAIKPAKKIQPTQYKTGWCAHGWCEGTKPRTFRGNPAPSCKSSSQECSCECHKKIDEMYEGTGIPRQIHDMSDYSVDHSRFVMPDLLALARARADARAAKKDPATPGAVVTAGHVFTPTPTGNRGRGQLEYQVLEALHEWIDPTFAVVPVTPQLLSGIMGTKNPPAPSTGAIHAVWVRWVGLEFARFQNRPAAFLGFVGEGTVQELDDLKLKSRSSRG